MKEDFALIIGINDYTPQENNGLRTLKGAINDANHFETWVKDPSGGNIKEKNCFKIISEPEPLKPAKEEIDDAFDKIIELINQGGVGARRLYFYFAGHGIGIIDSISDVALCLARWSELKRNNALSSEQYKNGISQFGLFEEVIFLADCCRNIKLNIKPQPPTFGMPFPDGVTGQTKFFVGYATQYQDQSFEVITGDLEMRGIFTKVLLDGLKGEAADNSGRISADSLRDYLIRETPVEAQKAGYKQQPEITSRNFISTDTLIVLPNFQTNKTLCHIRFSENRSNRVELMDHSLSTIETFDISPDNRIFKIELGKGLYALKDMSDDEECFFRVSPLNQEMNVDF